MVISSPIAASSIGLPESRAEAAEAEAAAAASAREQANPSASPSPNPNPNANPNPSPTPGQVEAYCHPPSADTLVFVCGLPAMYEVPPYVNRATAKLARSLGVFPSYHPTVP